MDFQDDLQDLIFLICMPISKMMDLGTLSSRRQNGTHNLTSGAKMSIFIKSVRVFYGGLERDRQFYVVTLWLALGTLLNPKYEKKKQ